MAKCGKGWKSNDGETNLSCSKHWAHPTPVHKDANGTKFVRTGRKSVFIKPDKNAK